ncbi:MAG: SDR family NAD(P)-dependent oxidoreductase [Anaerolineae bacterium]|nr:SDR family NAD(P)-dependent oxidoreductase [Anaerolineae bacterium]MDW8068007.1 SDR family NAD(P)-dependent oxidoreductase [Anaerolineae bacterium]
MARPFLQGRVALVTGASSGIGRATALLLARAGAYLALVARREDLLREVAGEMERMGQEALVLPADVTRPEEMARAAEQTIARWGRIDVLVACAGAYIRAPVLQMTIADVEQSMAVNFYGVLHAVQAVLPHMVAQKSGHIVIVSSADGKKGIPPDGPYVAAKFAVTGLGDILRQELRPYGIAVTTIFPGRVDTPMIAHLRVPWISAKIPPETVARAVLRALRRRSPEIILPFQVRLFVYLSALFPSLGDWFTRQFHLEGWEQPGRS